MRCHAGAAIGRDTHACRPLPHPALPPQCGFRPSDDNTGLPFLISANAMAAVELEHLATMAGTGAGPRLAAIAQRAAALGAQLRASTEALARHTVAGFGVICECDAEGGRGVATVASASLYYSYTVGRLSDTPPRPLRRRV